MSHPRAHRVVDPWFRAHPRAAVAVMAAVFAGVLALQAVDGRGSDAIALLYVLPIALGAVAFGMWGGLISAAAGYGAFSVFAVAERAGQVGPDGWVTRAVAMFLLGLLLGRSSEQIARAGRQALEHQREQLNLRDVNRRYGEGLELSDSVLQYVAAAKWLVEQGDQAAASRLLADALEQGQRMVGELLPTIRISSSPSDGPVDALPEEVGVAGVLGVLADHAEHEPTQRVDAVPGDRP
jgi:K+-sensing histidine kinase KdpD